MINVKNIFNEVSLIALTETWLEPISNLSILCQDTYKNVLARSRQRGKDRGVAIIRRDNIQMQTFKQTNLPDLQILIVKIYFSGQTMFITLLYKATKLRNVTFPIELMTPLIETGHNNETKHVVCGGFNQDFNKKSTITKKQIETFSNVGFNIVSTPSEATRNTTSLKTTIDVVFADYKFETNVIETTITDLCFIIIRTYINLKNDTNSKKENCLGRTWSKLKQHKMQALLNCSLASKLREENHSLKQHSTQEDLRWIEEVLSFALEEVIAPKQISNKPIQRCWIKNEVKKQKCFQAYLKSNTDENRSTYIKQRYFNKTPVQKTKINFFENFLAKITILWKDSYTKLKKKMKSEPETTIADESNLPFAA